MATIVGSRTPLFYKSVPGGPPVILDTSKFSGNIFYVDSNVGTDGAGYGSTPDAPFDSIDYAVGKCTENQGDVIIVLPGHSEALAASITCDVAGVSIIGLGEGAARPQITVAVADDGIDITADDVLIENLYFNEATQAGATSNINVGAGRARIRRCHFDVGANDVDAITVTAAGELLTVEECTYIPTADGPDDFILFEGVVDRPIIRNNVLIGSDGTNAIDDGILNFNNQACTNAVIVNNVFGDGNQACTVFAGGGNVVGEVIGPNSYAASATNADNTGVTLASFGANSITAAAIANAAIDAATFAAGAINAAAIADDAIDAAAFADDAITKDVIAAGAIEAAAFAAGAIDAAAIADAAIDSATFAASAGEKTCDGIVVTRATAALPQTADAALFTVTGLCLLKRIVGYVTVAIGNVPNGTKLKVNPAGVGADTDLCAVVDLDNAAVGTFYQITGTFANAGVLTVDIPIAKVQATEVVVPPGAIEVDCAGSDGGDGRMQWSVTYVPLESGASIVAA